MKKKRSKPKDGYLDFKSKAAYMRWENYLKRNNIKTGGKVPIRINGKVLKKK